MRRTEADLCARFRAQLEPGWTVHPEYAAGVESWDMLLVLDSRREPTARESRADKRWGGSYAPLSAGTQVGIEAKLRANVTVLRQALPCDWQDVEVQPGPDFRAVLVPKATEDFRYVSKQLGIVVLEAEPKVNGYLGPVATRLERHLRSCVAWPHESRHRLPEVTVDGPAGVPSPVQMTDWRIRAIKLCIRLRDHGYVTRGDFVELGISTTTWYHRWLEKGERVGRRQHWVAKECFVPFDERHPEAAAQLREKMEAKA